MWEYEEVLIKETKEVPTSVTCNKCGKSQELTGDEWDREWQSNKFHPISISFGYGSSFDGDNWSFDLCEECLEKLIKTFKHEPEGYDEEIPY